MINKETLILSGIVRQVVGVQSQFSIVAVSYAGAFDLLAIPLSDLQKLALNAEQTCTALFRLNAKGNPDQPLPIVDVPDLGKIQQGELAGTEKELADGFGIHRTNVLPDCPTFITKEQVFAIQKLDRVL